MIARAPSQSSMVTWPATPKFCTTPITFLSSALPLSSIFPSIIAKLNKVQEEGGNYREAYEAYFYLEADTARRFPSDAEFMQALLTRDLYHFRRSFYMLACLENQHHTKDPMVIEPARYTIEHVMPQNALAHDEWRETLGPNCEDGFEALLNNLGNLTLTAYNSELSDGAFEDKKKTHCWRLR